jgi:signal transduction histidine kinase
VPLAADGAPVTPAVAAVATVGQSSDPQSALATALARERRGADRFAMVASVVRLMTANLELDDMLQRAADAVHEWLGYPNVDLPLVAADDPETLVLRIRGGRYKDLIHHEDRLPVAAGVMGAAVRERRPQLVNDVAADPRYVSPPAGTEGIRAELAVPIILGERVLGVLNVESGEAFDDGDLAGLQVVADALAVAIENARLFERGLRLAVLEDRQRLARDLHDSVTQTMAAIQLLAQSLAGAWRRDPAEGERRTDRLVGLARGALGEMRTLLRELNPPPTNALRQSSMELPMPPVVVARKHGLAAGLEHLAEGMAALGGLSIHLDTADYTAQAVEVEDALVRVCQEALANVVKHAKARRVTVRVAVAGGVAGSTVRLAVSDDGVGLPAELPPPTSAGGQGLRGIRERLALLGGMIELGRAAAGGAKIEVSLPARPRGTTR